MTIHNPSNGRKMKVGCHLSSSGGYLAMAQTAESIGANVFQFFTRNPRGGAAKPIDKADAAAFMDYAGEHGIGPILAHAPYTLNAAGADERVREFAESVMADDLMQKFVNHEVDKVDIVYNQFLNAATQHVTVEDYLPVTAIESDEEHQVNSDYIIEPSADKLLSELIPKILRTQLYKTLSDSIASEHGARMISMTKATDNATEILRDLRLKYNNARQYSITNELIEIVSGANALNG